MLDAIGLGWNLCLVDHLEAQGHQRMRDVLPETERVRALAYRMLIGRQQVQNVFTLIQVHPGVVKADLDRPRMNVDVELARVQLVSALCFRDISQEFFEGHLKGRGYYKLQIVQVCSHLILPIYFLIAECRLWIFTG